MSSFTLVKRHSIHTFFLLLSSFGDSTETAVLLKFGGAKPEDIKKLFLNGEVIEWMNIF